MIWPVVGLKAAHDGRFATENEIGSLSPSDANSAAVRTVQQSPRVTGTFTPEKTGSVFTVTVKSGQVYARIDTVRDEENRST